MDLGKWFVNKILQNAQTMQNRLQRQNQISGEKNNFTLEAVLEDVERLSAQISKMTMGYQLEQNLSRQEFDTFLSSITEKITYLPEALKVIEKDEQNKQALLRSANPVKNKKDIEYFELLVTPKVHLKLTRIRNKNHESNSISFVIAFDLLERLINDIESLIKNIIR